MPACARPPAPSPSEGLGCILWAAVALGGLEGFAFVANIFWLLTAITRGWAALGLYKAAAANGGN